MSESSCPLNCGGAPQLKFYQAFTFATPIIFTLVLLLLFCVLYVRRRQTARAMAQIRAHFSARGLFSAWPVDHGLTKSFRDALPIIVFDENFAASREDNQCAVCLSDYQLNEKLQQLPLCDHVFHVECIDEWLANNATCPICRTSLLQPGKLVPMESLTPRQNEHQQQQQQQQQQQHAAPPECSKSQEEAAGTSRAAEAAAAAAAAGSNEDSTMQQEKDLKEKKPVAHRNSLSMEDAVKDSIAAEHVIQIER